MYSNIEVKKVVSKNSKEITKFIFKNSNINLNKKVLSIYQNEEMVKNRIESGIEIDYIAVVDNEIIGLISLINTDSNTWSVITNYILKEYRRKGIGSLLINKFFKEIKQNKKNIKISVAVNDFDIQSKVLYISKKFQQEGYIYSPDKKNNICLYGLIV